MSANDIDRWLNATGWSVAQLSRAIALTDGKGMGSGLECAIMALRAARRVTASQARRARGFIAAHPAPGEYADWEVQIALSASARAVMRREAYLASVEAVEQARKDRRARLLAAEHPGPRGRPRPAPPLPDDIAEIADLDAATIRALSGGTIGKAELFRAAGARP